MLFIVILRKFKIVSECSNANFENTKDQPYLLGVMLLCNTSLKRCSTQKISENLPSNPSLSAEHMHFHHYRPPCLFKYQAALERNIILSMKPRSWNT